MKKKRVLTPCTLFVLLAVLLLGGPAALKAQDNISFGDPMSRPDRLLTITGPHLDELLAEYSIDEGTSWFPATLYPGVTVDQWRATSNDTWKYAAVEGKIPASRQYSAWNYFFDVPMPADNSLLRLKKTETGEVVKEQQVDLSGMDDVFVVDHRNAAQLAGGSLPSPWTLSPGTQTPAVDSIFCPVDDPYAPSLTLEPNLSGWHHVYVGTEASSPFQMYVTPEVARYAIPEYMGMPTDRPMREVYLKSADLTNQNIGLALGGARNWQDASVRYVRFVPMTPDEVTHFHDVRELAATEGRPFAGYVEVMTPAYYEPESQTLLDYTRNEMQLNKLRGSTEVYVHAIRAGSKAWYHSDVVDRFTGWGNWGNWMAQGDPMAVAVTEGKAAGLKVFADMGMNVSYTQDGLRDGMITAHPEYLYGGSGIFLDYSVSGVRDYVVSIATELMTKYNVDGINLDFARFAPNYIFTKASLDDVVSRIDAARQTAEQQWGHDITIATRIPSYRYGNGSYSGEFPEFLAALETWAQNGWIDQAMACSMGYVESVGQLSVARYADAVAGTDVELWGDLYGGGAFVGTSESQWIDVAEKWVEEGVDGGFFFYTMDRPTDFEQINWQLRLIDFPDEHVGPYVETPELPRLPIIEHIGATDPTIEGFTLNDSNGSSSWTDASSSPAAGRLQEVAGSVAHYVADIDTYELGGTEGWTATAIMKLNENPQDEIRINTTLFVSDGQDLWALDFLGGTGAAETGVFAAGDHLGGGVFEMIELSTSVDPTDGFHVYQIVFDPEGDGGNGSVTYYVDGLNVGTQTRDRVYNTNLSRLAFGDNASSYSTASDSLWSLVRLEAWQNVIWSLPGDANCDGTVNDADAAILAANWLGSGVWTKGDFNGDGIVDDADASLMATNWCHSVATANVPEPCAFALLFAALASLTAVRTVTRLIVTRRTDAGRHFKR